MSPPLSLPIPCLPPRGRRRCEAAELSSEVFRCPWPLYTTMGASVTTSIQITPTGTVICSRAPTTLRGCLKPRGHFWEPERARRDLATLARSTSDRLTVAASGPLRQRHVARVSASKESGRCPFRAKTGFDNKIKDLSRTAFTVSRNWQNGFSILARRLCARDDRRSRGLPIRGVLWSR